MLIKRWEALASYAEEQLQSQQRGVPMSRHLMEAMNELRKLRQFAELEAVIEVTLAMYLLEDDSPRRFRSHQAFGRQMVRRVRALVDGHIGTYYDTETGAVKRVYRDSKPRTTDTLAKFLVEAFGVAGVSLARLERTDRERKAQEQASLNRALTQLT